MRAALYGRIVFGASAMMYGVVSLMWHDSAMWQRLRTWEMPLASVIAWALAIALVAGGAAMLYPRTARFASVVLGVVYGLFTLACIPDIIAAPANPASYVDPFERLSIVCGAIAVYAAIETNAARSATLGRAARLGLGVCAISFAWAQIVYLQYTASLVPTWIPPNQTFWTILTTVAFALAAVAILINRRARLAMRLMALMLALFGVLVWLPQIAAHPGTLFNWSEFSENNLMAAASWLMAAVRAF